MQRGKVRGSPWCRLRSTQSAVVTAVTYYLTANNVSPDSVNIVAAAPDGTAKAYTAASTGDAITVTVHDHYDFILIGPVIGLFGGSFRNGVNLGSRATMRKE